jgi:ATP-dependent protease Clp ATPase subunit
VRKLVAGPGVYICNECVELCNQIMDFSDHPSSEGAISPDQPSTWEVYSPHNPAAVELRALQQQVAYIARQLAALAQGMEEERGSAAN